MRTSLWTLLALAGVCAGAVCAQDVLDGTPAPPSDGAYDGSCGVHGCPGGPGCKHHHGHHKCMCGNRGALVRSQNRPWHGGFYDPAYGAPLALVVPPTAERQTNWGWGVGTTRVSRIDHQFLRPYPGPPTQGRTGFGYGFAPTPPWPSDTTQFGIYYVRGPW